MNEKIEYLREQIESWATIDSPELNYLSREELIDSAYEEMTTLMETIDTLVEESNKEMNAIIKKLETLKL